MNSRRDFLTRTGLTFAAAALASVAEAPAAAHAQDVSDWEAVRGLFSLSPSFLHFGGLYLASHPAPVQAAIDMHRQGLNDNPVDYLHQQQPALEAAVLRAAAAYLGGDPRDIALTDSTTMGLGLLYTGLDLRAGQEVITTTHDFYATHEALRYAADRTGATVRQVTLYQQPAQATVDEMVQAISGALTERTRIVAITWVHSSTGVKVPVRAIADVLDGVNAQRAASDRVLLCVDGVHGFGVEDVNVADLGCDFFAAGTHKWMLGPRGTGLVWGRGNQAWSAMRPTIPTFGSGQTSGSLMTPGGFKPFEHRWALREAFDLHQQIGRTRVSERIHGLNGRLKQGLASVGGVRFTTPMGEDVSAGLVCFDIDGLRAAQVVDRLHARDTIATETPYTISHARLAAGLINNEEQVDRVVEAVRQISAAA